MSQTRASSLAGCALTRSLAPRRAELLDKLQRIPGVTADLLTQGAELLYAYRDELDDDGKRLMAELYVHGNEQGWTTFAGGAKGTDNRAEQIAEFTARELGDKGALKAPKDARGMAGAASQLARRNRLARAGPSARWRRPFRSRRPGNSLNARRSRHGCGLSQDTTRSIPPRRTRAASPGPSAASRARLSRRSRQRRRPTLRRPGKPRFSPARWSRTSSRSRARGATSCSRQSPSKGTELGYSSAGTPAFVIAYRELDNNETELSVLRSLG
jgi:hypothetical protein